MTRGNVLPNILTGIVTSMALVVGSMRIHQQFFQRDSPPPQPKRLVAEWKTFAVGRRIGPPKAAVTIVEFADFQCPFCAKAASELAEIRRRHPDDVAIVYRHYPLSFHPFARAAAQATECAAPSGSFASMYDLLYAEQSSLGVTPWEDYARRAGATDSLAFNRCMADTMPVRKIIDRDIAAGKELGIIGTPAFLINDRFVSGYAAPGMLTPFVEKALASAATANSETKPRAIAGEPVR